MLIVWRVREGKKRHGGRVGKTETRKKKHGQSER